MDTMQKIGKKTFATPSDFIYIFGMNNQLDLFHTDTGRPNFESYSHANGIKSWYATEFAEALGYESFETFRKGAIARAMTACTTLGIPIDDNFVPFKRDINGKQVSDFKLTRFACYLTAMNGDVKKPNVAAAQAYFVTFADAIQQYIQAQDGVERLVIRSDVADHERSLSSTAFDAGVTHYPFFQNEGYRGLYNMNLSALRQLKKIPSDRSPLDFMGKQELAANLFRITQTEAKIQNDRIFGQKNLEQTAFSVGRQVRDTMRRISNTVPEKLPPADDIKSVKKSLKGTHKGFKKLDAPKKVIDKDPTNT